MDRIPLDPCRLGCKRWALATTARHLSPRRFLCEGAKCSSLRGARAAGGGARAAGEVLGARAAGEVLGARATGEVLGARAAGEVLEPQAMLELELARCSIRASIYCATCCRTVSRSYANWRC